MIQKMVKQFIPFESLVGSIKKLGPVEQRLLWLDWLNAQKQSAAYQEWVDRENDLYDEVFADILSMQ